MGHPIKLNILWFFSYLFSEQDDITGFTWFRKKTVELQGLLKEKYLKLAGCYVLEINREIRTQLAFVAKCTRSSLILTAICLNMNNTSKNLHQSTQK